MRSVQWKSALITVGGILCLGSTPRAPAAQENTGTIQGRVMDAATRRPLQSAQVFIVGTQVGAVTNADGQYRILNVAAGQRELRARLLGYAAVAETVQVVAGQTVTADFDLRQSAVRLDAVVTTGTGSQLIEERKLGNTVSTIEPPPFAPISSFSEVLQGREPGIVALPSGGLTGEGTRIRIRGNASLSQSNEPIIYVDGIRMDNSGGFGASAFVATGGGGYPSRLDDIDPNSIERVEILKGAAAATLYGTEASNGVIQIFTKQGTTGAPRWSFNAEQSVLRYPTGRIEAQYGFARSDTQATRLSSYYQQDIRPYQVFSRQFATRLFETGYNTTLAANVSGGTPLVTYFVSGRFMNENGPFGVENFGGLSNDVARRYQGAVNLGITPSDRFRLHVRTLYSDTHNEVPDNNNSIYSPYTLAMFSQPQRAQCDASSVAGPGACTGAGNPTGSSSFSTIREALQREFKQDARHFNGVIRATYLPFQSFALDGIFGIDYTGQRSSTFLPFGNDVDRVTNQADDGQKAIDSRVHQEITLGATGNWSTLFTPAVTSEFLFGAQGFITRDDNEASANQDFPGPGIEVVGGGSNPQVFEQFIQIVNAGFFAQEQIGWQDWVFGTIGARYDYNSAFGEAAGGVLYPKASLSVIPSDHPQWRSNAISTLRVRTAVGQAGRQPGAFDKLTTYGPLVSERGSGLVPQNLGNPNLKPEISTEWEVGTEIGLFQDRIGIEFTRWDRVLKDALVERQFPVTGGFPASQLDNVGEMKAWGWELGLRGFAVNRPDLTVDLWANTSFLRQVVSSLGGAPPIKVGLSYPRYRNFIVEGLPPGALLGAKLLGPCPGGATTTAQGGPCLRPGQLPFDLNDDGVPDTEAEMLAILASAPANINVVDPLAADDDNDGDFLDHYSGKPYPDFQGSVGGTITVKKNWQLRSLFEYKAGNYTISDLTGAFRRSNNSNGGNTRRRAEVEATLLNPASTAQQRLEAAKIWANELRALTPYDGMNQSSPGDFVRWRELSLTYTTPVRFANSVGFTDMSITFGVRNLALWTKYGGVDPEVNVYGRDAGLTSGFGSQDNNFGDGIDAFGFPLPRRFTFSVRAAF